MISTNTRTGNNAGTRFLDAVATEWQSASRAHAPINSAHEGYAVILEELDEFWEEVRKRRKDRRPLAMYSELVQVAAMAMRTALDVIDPNVIGDLPHDLT